MVDVERMEPYSQPQEVIEDRGRWSVALLDRLLQHGRHAGWVDGDPVAIAHDHDELKRRLEARRDCTPLDPRLLGMEWLAIRLHLDDVQLDTLWRLHQERSASRGLLGCVRADTYLDAPHVECGSHRMRGIGPHRSLTTVTAGLIGASQRSLCAIDFA